MPVSGDGFEQCYNDQASVDTDGEGSWQKSEFRAGSKASSSGGFREGMRLVSCFLDGVCSETHRQTSVRQAARQSALNEMYGRHPERFSRGKPRVQMPPMDACINPVPEDADQATIEKGVNFPTLSRVIEKAI